MTDRLEHDLKKARRVVNALAAALRQRAFIIKAADLGVQPSEAPFLLLCTATALVWRTEELARSTCDALEREDLSVAALLARAVIESAALSWNIAELLEDRHGVSLEEFSGSAIRLLMGQTGRPDLPRAFRIGHSIDRMDKRMPDYIIRKHYNALSDIAHPNFRGVFAMYAKLDAASLSADFGRGVSPIPLEDTKQGIIDALLSALELFLCASARTVALLRVFLTELKKG